MPGNLPKKTARALLDIEDSAFVPIIRNPNTTTTESEAVFYFPGCGSERLFSQVGLATQAMLWQVGVQTVLPPAISAAATRSGAPASSIRQRKSSPIIECCFIVWPTL